jgi:hypothetical protein
MDIVEGLEEVEDVVKAVREADEPPASLEMSDREAGIVHEAPPARFDPQAEGHTASVLCIAGRGVLDDLAAAIAVQLFKKHGLQADLAPYERFSRSRFDSVDLTGVSIICVISFDAAESPPYLRNLLRRLHQRAAEADLIVGLVLPESPLEGEAVIRKTSAATSFKELVDACVNAARSQSTDGVSWAGLNPAEDESAAQQAAPEGEAPVSVLRGA